MDKQQAKGKWVATGRMFIEPNGVQTVYEVICDQCAEIQNEKVPERLSEKDVEIVEQSTDNVAQEDEEVEEPSVEERKFETQFLYKIEKITQHIKEAGLTNWGYVKDHLQDLIRDINLNAGGWRANERE